MCIYAHTHEITVTLPFQKITNSKNCRSIIIYYMPKKLTSLSKRTIYIKYRTRLYIFLDLKNDATSRD